MANYSSGIATKNKILNSCKYLFYYNGIIKTTYNDICQHAHVYPGSISHHFDGKTSIASQIYLDIMENISRQIRLLFPNEEELILLILQMCSHLRLFYDDEYYRRFSIEFEADYFAIANLSVYKDFFNKAYSYSEDMTDPERAEFYFAAYSGMDKGIEPYIDMHINSLTFEKAITFTNELYFFFIKKEELNKSIEKSLKIMKNLKITNEVFNIFIKFVK